MSTLPRSTSGTMRRMGVAPASGSIGAVNEDDFRNSFNSGVKISIFDARTLSMEMGKARDCMADDKQDWNRRTTALKKFRGIHQNGGRDFEDLYLQEVLQSKEALLVSVKDLRSQVCREACVTVSYLSEELGVGMLRIAESLLLPLINLIQNSAKVMSTSGILAATFLVRNIQHPTLIPIVLSSLSSKSKEIRRMTQSMAGMVLEWEAKKVERSLPQIVDAIKSGLGDADPGVRTNARGAYNKLEAAFPRSAEMLYKSLDPSKQRALAGGTASQSSSTQSIVSEKDGMAFNHRPGTIGLQKQKEYFGGRSTSEIDPAAARRAGMMPPRRMLPGGGAGTDEAMRKMTTTLSSLHSRMGLPPSGGSSNSAASSRVMRSASVVTGSGTLTNPAREEGRRMGLSLRPPNGATRKDASPLRRGSGADGARKFSPDFDDAVPKPIRRRASLGAPPNSASSRSVTAFSTAPNEQKEGLVSLKESILGSAPLVARNLFSVQEVLSDGTGVNELTKYLPALLIKLLSKQMNESDETMQSHLARTLDVVRSSFPAQEQLDAVAKAIDVPVVYSGKMRGAILAYVRELVKQADSPLAIRGVAIRRAVSKVLSWAALSKGTSTVGQCEQLVLDLFNANEADFRSMMEGLKADEREYTKRLCRARSNSVHDELNQGTEQPSLEQSRKEPNNTVSGSTLSQSALDDLLSLGLVQMTVAEPQPVQPMGSSAWDTPHFNDPWSNAAPPTPAPPPLYPSVPTPTANDPWSAPSAPVTASVEHNTLNSDPFASLSLAPMQPLNGASRMNAKTAETFLGANSSLVNLDNLIGGAAPAASTANPFLLGSTAPAPVNPLTTNRRKSPTLNEMRAGSTPTIPPTGARTLLPQPLQLQPAPTNPFSGF